MFVFKAIAALGLAALPFVSAQVEGESPVQCMDSYDWANNTINQNPCLVSAWLQAQCSGGKFTMNALPVGYHYIGPTNITDTQNPCICSTPVYMLDSACAACQNRTFISWTSFHVFCPASMLSSEGTYSEFIPEETLVPHWAYLLPSASGDFFDPIAAKAAGDLPESSQVQSTTSSTTSTTSTLSTTSTTSTTVASTTTTTSISTPTSSNKSGGGGGSKTDVGAIAGGVVGGVLGLAIIALLGFFLFRHRNNNSAPPTNNTATIGTTRTGNEMGQTGGGVHGQYTGGTGGTGGYGQPGYGGQPEYGVQPGFGGQPGGQPGYYNNGAGVGQQMRYSGMPEV